MNKYIEGEQCKILWHVYDVKTSHRDPKVLTTVIDIISYICGREYPLTVTRVKFREYLGITIDFSDKGKVKFTMYYSIADMLEDLPEDINTGEAATPSRYHMLTIN